jgi:pimeloyl-ACP methyl ester carboxylesterase
MMTRTIPSIFIFTLLLSSCASTDTHTTSSLRTMNNHTQSDSISGYAPVNGLNMYYEIHGSGMPLVLIHGGGSTLRTSFGRVLDDLAKSHQVIAVEMQAHGHTADIDRELSFEQDADDIAELLNHLKIEKANIFGFSNGASTTLQFAIRHPEKTNRIIVASTFYKKAGAPDWFWEMMSQPKFENMPQPYKDAFLSINPDTNALYRMYERDVARMLSFPDITEEEMRSIKAPAFIMLGDKDVTTLEHATEMHRLLLNSRLAILPGGHGDYIGELTTPFDSTVVAATLSMINTFLDESTIKSTVSNYKSDTVINEVD